MRAGSVKLTGNTPKCSDDAIPHGEFPTAKHPKTVAAPASGISPLHRRKGRSFCYARCPAAAARSHENDSCTAKKKKEEKKTYETRNKIYKSTKGIMLCTAAQRVPCVVMLRYQTTQFQAPPRALDCSSARFALVRAKGQRGKI